MNSFFAKRLGSRSIPKSIVLVALLGYSLRPVWSGADEQVRQVQEELRRRNLYFGEVDGRNTEEIHEAMRRYQQRKGFPPTGVFEQETLRSLGIQSEPPTPGAESLPDVPILKSDSAREVSEKDRKFLEDLASTDPPPSIGEGPAAEQVVKATPAPASPGRAAAPSEREETRPAPPETTPVLGKTPGEPAPSVPNSTSSREIAAIGPFVRHYLDACQTNDLQQEMAFYADTMHYFDQGTVGREFVERDVKRYYKRWPHRDYTLLSVTGSPRPNNSSEFVVRFRIRYALSSEKAHASGQTDNVFIVKAEGGHWKFTSMQESRVHG